MLLTAKSFCFFEINAWPLLPKYLTILNQKWNPVEQWKVRYVGQLSILSWNSRLPRRLIFPYHSKTNLMLLTAKSVCFFEINAWPLLPKYLTILNQKWNPVEQWKVRYVGQLSILSWNSRLPRRLIFPYHFKTNGMILTAKSFCFFEINAWPLPPKNFTNLYQKLNPVEQWKIRYVG